MTSIIIRKGKNSHPTFHLPKIIIVFVMTKNGIFCSSLKSNF
jgi:hypothetical protein